MTVSALSSASGPWSRVRVRPALVMTERSSVAVQLCTS
jgi:hypothetical protein